MAGEEYRATAAEMAMRARYEKSSEVRAQLLTLQRGYLRLAEQAQRNATFDQDYGTASPVKNPTLVP
jgi:hypothetical protein